MPQTASTTPTPEPATTQNPIERAAEACAAGEATICAVVEGVTGSPSAGRWAEVLLGTPLRIALVVVLAFVIRWLAHRFIDRVADGIATGTDRAATRASERSSRATALLDSSPLMHERRVQRARTLQSVLRSLATGATMVVAAMLVLGEIGINLGPLIAGAGIAGVALGFGAQTLVKDFLSGIFMIVEDQYGVGDVIDLGEANGSVEAVALRVTRLRDVNGTVWYVRNGEVLRVGNMSQGWARAVIDVGVAYDSDIGRVQDLLGEVARELQADEDWSALVIEEPEVWGVEAISADALVMRLVVKTAPLEQWKVSRELRRRIKAAFDAEGIELPHAQRTVWMRDRADERPNSAAGAPAGGAPSSSEPARKVPPGEHEAARDVDTGERSGT